LALLFLDDDFDDSWLHWVIGHHFWHSFLSGVIAIRVPPKLRSPGLKVCLI
jgi:hypothetical protein